MTATTHTSTMFALLLVMTFRVCAQYWIHTATWHSQSNANVQEKTRQGACDVSPLPSSLCFLENCQVKTHFPQATSDLPNIAQTSLSHYLPNSVSQELPVINLPSLIDLLEVPEGSSATLSPDENASCKSSDFPLSLFYSDSTV